jgi:hypothetical protein
MYLSGAICHAMFYVSSIDDVRISCGSGVVATRVRHTVFHHSSQKKFVEIAFVLGAHGFRHDLSSAFLFLRLMFFHKH